MAKDEFRNNDAELNELAAKRDYGNIGSEKTKSLSAKECANPDCNETFVPYNRRQRICGSRLCKFWLHEQNSHKKIRYRCPHCGKLSTKDQLKKVE